MYLLGPEEVIGKEVADQLEKRKLARSVERIEGATPVDNAISFARYEKGDFGWGVVVPGYNFAVASTTRPSDAAARGLARQQRGVRAALAHRPRPRGCPSRSRAICSVFSRATRTTLARRSTTGPGCSGTTRRSRSAQQAQIDQITELIPVQANAP